MAFRGWPAEALEFFERLEADNSKSFWQRNKEIYETQVRAPMEELLDELAPDFGEGRIFRPYRTSGSAQTSPRTKATLRRRSVTATSIWTRTELVCSWAIE
jgi:uncharacterized protein (DUF2461 family)